VQNSDTNSGAIIKVFTHSVTEPRFPVLRPLPHHIGVSHANCYYKYGCPPHIEYYITYLDVKVHTYVAILNVPK